MEKNVLFSILIPAYNAQKYISECIESVIKQKYKNWELLIIDDGSSDDTLQICKHYSSQDNRVVVIHQDNCGVSTTRNILIEKARGEYLIFLDADDFWITNDILYNINEVVHIKKPDIICWWSEIEDIQNSITKKYKNNINFAKKLFSGKEFLSEVLQGGDFNWWLWLYAIKRDLWLNPRITFNAQRKICEDEEVLFKIIARAHSIWNIGEYAYCYRIGNASSAMGTMSKEQFEDMLKVADNNMKYVNRSDLFDKKLKNNLIRNFSSVYLKLGLKLRDVVSPIERDLYYNILSKYKWMLKKSLGYLSLSFSIKVIIVMIFGNRVGFNLLNYIVKVLHKVKN